MDLLLNVRPIRLFSFYLAFLFCISVVLGLRHYRAVANMVIKLGSRWPNLLRLILEHRGVLLGWETLRPLLIMATLIVANTVACQFVWPSAGNFAVRDLVRLWLLVPVAIAAGAAMLAFDIAGLLGSGSIDEKATERYFDRAEWWLRGWRAPAVRVFSLGFVNPRSIVSKEVRSALEGATGWLVEKFWWMATQAMLRIGFGLTLWLGWAMWLWLVE